MRHALTTDAPVLNEATCNQVNQDGGYTGMTPATFRRFVEGIADQVGLPMEHVILGGDHLGPNPWRDRPAEDALAEAEQMVAAYVAAGFTKLHLDCSMGCAGEPAALDDGTTAARAARLAAVAERTAGPDADRLRYIIGTPEEQFVLRPYSLSDRIRYYWARPEAEAAVDGLRAALAGHSVPLPLFWQHLPAAAHFADVPLDIDALLIWRVTQSHATYHAASPIPTSRRPSCPSTSSASTAKSP